MTKMFVNSGAQRGCSFEIQEEMTLVGRGPASDIRVEDASISRQHVIIIKKGAKYFIEDLKSRNGTRINGHPIKPGEEVELPEGVPVSIGRVLISLGRSCPVDPLTNQYPTDLSNKKVKRTTDLSDGERRLRPRESLELIYGVCLTLMQSLDINQICCKILDSLLYCLKRMDNGVVLLAKAETGEFEEIASRSRTARKGERIRFSRSIARKVFREGRPVMVPDTSLEGKYAITESVGKLGVKSVMCVPLISKVGTRGVIYVHSVKVAQGFRKEDLMFATGLCTPAALAIENALLYSKSKGAKEALKKARDDLEMEVEARTAELMKANDKLEELSVTDGLTGLYNFRYLMQILESEYKRSVRYKHRLALLMIDIDHFKELNDNFGHPCGDFVIKNTALLLKHSVRSTDIVARYGGDEIAIILLEADKETALEVAKKLRAEVENYAFNWGGKPLHVTVSIGLAGAPADHIENWDQLLSAADRALYQAKRAGKNTVVTSQKEEKKD